MFFGEEPKPFLGAFTPGIDGVLDLGCSTWVSMRL